MFTQIINIPNRLKCLAALFLLSPAITFSQVRVNVDLSPPASWTIDPLIFGSFSEEQWGDLVPGIYEQYIVNPSLEEWYADESVESKTQVIWSDIPKSNDIAFPWEKRTYQGSASFKMSEESANSKHAQEITVNSGAKASVLQRLPLPDYRTLNYKVSFYAKKTGNVDLKIEMQNLSGSSVLGRYDAIVLSDQWTKYDFEVQVHKSSDKWRNRYGIYNLAFVIEGSGSILLDQVTLFPSDCVEGMFNPETLKNFKDLKVTMIRWPGGNFTSGYHWYNSIGALIDRPSEPNRAWNGMTNNHLGTDEFLRFCELAEIEPIMGVGFGEITAKEVADWVEYCNGDASTPMGAQRAANGRTEPYNVKYWGVGNEVYGDYQIGNTNSVDYAEGLIVMSNAMRERDPNIEILACGFGVHNAYREPTNLWNKDVFEIAGDHFELFDVHLYVYGATQSQAAAASKENLFRAYAASNYYLRNYIDNLKKTINLKDSKKDHKLTFLEWGVLPGTSTNQTPLRQTFVNLLCSSVQYNEMIRQGEFVRMSAINNFSFYVSPVGGHTEPVNPRSILFENSPYLSGGKLLNVSSDNMPTYNVTQAYESIGVVENVPELDILAVRKGNDVYLTIVNRSAKASLPCRVTFENGKVQSAEGDVYTSTSPFDLMLWTNSTSAPLKQAASITLNSETVAYVDVPKLSYSFIKIKLSE